MTNEEIETVLNLLRDYRSENTLLTATEDAFIAVEDELSAELSYVTGAKEKTND